jgi:hypothetical protein
MQRLEVSCELRHTYMSLGAKGLKKWDGRAWLSNLGYGKALDLMNAIG